MGGNKVRQAEYYFGEALAQGADTVLSTSAVQSNHLRVVAGAAAKFGMRCIVQREDRVKNMPDIYHKSGNAFLQSLYGAEVMTYPEGEDEAGADAQLHEVADGIRAQGGAPYIIHLGADQPAVGAYGYVDAALEILDQANQQGIKIDAVVTASGSAATHSGLVAGLRAAGSNTPVYGICVRRDKAAQAERVWQRVHEISARIGTQDTVKIDDVWLTDDTLGTGYGKANSSTYQAIDMLAKLEAIVLDPVYTGKSMAGLFGLIKSGVVTQDANVVFLHTGGTPAVFAYPDLLSSINKQVSAG